MCRFNSGFFYRNELLRKYRYYWRVEWVILIPLVLSILTVVGLTSSTSATSNTTHSYSCKKTTKRTVSVRQPINAFAKLSHYGIQVSRLRCWNTCKRSRPSGMRLGNSSRRTPNTSRLTTRWISSPTTAEDPTTYAIVSADGFSRRLNSFSGSANIIPNGP